MIYLSPLSSRYNGFNKKTYEKRDTIQKSPRPNYNAIEG